jgi:hypothetical protein
MSRPRPAPATQAGAFTAAVAAGRASQVVILGAGFDSRAHRLPALRSGRVFEVDHPATQATKRARCEACDLPLHPRSTFPSTSSEIRWSRPSRARASSALLDAG